MLSGKKTDAPAQSASHEHYLRALWEVISRDGYARLTDVARELGISHPTLSVGIKALERDGLVVHDARRHLALTPRGERHAREVHHRFRVLRAFLGDVLGVAPEQAAREACLIEHDISADTTERLVNLLKLIREDVMVGDLLHERLAHFHRSCSPSEACSTCGLSCLEPAPTP